MLNTPDLCPNLQETAFQGNWPENVDEAHKPDWFSNPFGGSAKRMTASGERQRLLRHLDTHIGTSGHDRAEDLKSKLQASGRPPLTGTNSEKKDRRRARNAVATRKLRAAKKAKVKR